MSPGHDGVASFMQVYEIPMEQAPITIVMILLTVIGYIRINY